MTIQYEKFSAHYLLEQMATKMNATFAKNCQTCILHIPEAYGTGSIVGYDFPDGVNLMIWDCTLREKLEIYSPSQRLHPLHFYFCKKGQFLHSLCDETMSYALNPLFSSISSNPAKCEEKMIIPNGIPLKLVNLQILKGKYRSKAICDIEKLPEAIYKLFEDLEGVESFLYMGNYNMQIADCVDQLIDNEANPLLEITLKEGKTLELLSLLFNQYAKDLDPSLKSSRIKEIYRDKITEAEKLLLHDLQNTPTIPDLAKQLGINQQKLKQGFKKLFGMPIAKYATKRKMEYARLLIMETDQPIGDIAFTVGYKNHSQFSKRFKSVFGFLPKTLRNNKTLDREINIGHGAKDPMSIA